MKSLGLAKYQDEKKQDSIQRVQWAIQTLRDLEGNHTKMKAEKLAEMTGLSRTALYKPHLRKLWDVKWVKIQKEKSDSRENFAFNKQIEELQQTICQLKKDLLSQEVKISKVKKQLDNEKMRSKVFKIEYEEQKKENEKLLYKHLVLLRGLHSRGIEITDFEEENISVN
ncbi:DUF6262 family protein [Bacillus cereus group sp. BC251]|nr:MULTISPECIES: DUF6262 family protein [Bacillus]KXY71360.1 hypothetical protein AT258_01790 [Bacillus wiedmannii]MBK0156916.1 hypothetical protein [Bacillus sp. S71]OJD74043.1 hypothetical protein BAU29_26395 [Bacillus sp. P14-1]COF05401.1 Uncharacterised protein [Streptococcus pneumoniae]HDX9505504.1 hypothetical protein [Bacillus thuringiensis]